MRRGPKRATASLLWVHETEGRPLAKPGDLSIVTRWTGDPVCIIETTQVEICAFEDVTDAFAATEGEGDGSLAYWREAHWAYFARECRRTGRIPDARMPVICEQFRVVYA